MLNRRDYSWLRSAFSALVRRKNVAPLGRTASLRLEALEARNVPSVAANDVFVSTLYQGILGRDTDAGGLAFWTGELDAGASRAEVALAVERSDEGVGRAVQILYKDLLGRPADGEGLNFWVESVRRGATIEQVKANLLGSDEFFAHAGGNLDVFLDAVYRAELGRGLDAEGQAYFSGTPDYPADRAAAAFEIMTSPEGEQVKLNNIYLETLDRPVDPRGEAFWLNALQQGGRTSEVIAAVVGSDEYFAKVEAYAAAANDPNVAADHFLVATQAFADGLPGVEQLDTTIITDPALVLPPPPTPEPALVIVETPVFAPHYFVEPVPYFADAPVFFDANPSVFFDAGPAVFVDPGPLDFVDPSFYCGCGGDIGYGY